MTQNREKFFGAANNLSDRIGWEMVKRPTKKKVARPNSSASGIPCETKTARRGKGMCHASYSKQPESVLLVAVYETRLINQNHTME